MLGISKKNKEQITEFTKVYGEILHGMHRDLTEFKSLVNNNEIAVKKLDDDINKKEKKIQIELEEYLNKMEKVKKSIELSLSNFTKERDDLLSIIEEISDAQKKSSTSIKNLFWFVCFTAILSLISVLLYLL